MHCVPIAAVVLEHALGVLVHALAELIGLSMEVGGAGVAARLLGPNASEDG